MKLLNSLSAFLLKPYALVLVLVLSVAAAGGSYYLYQNSQQELSKVKASSKIFITATSATSQPLFVRARIEGESFTVEMNQPESGDITFDWWIVNTEPITLGQD